MTVICILLGGPNDGKRFYEDSATLPLEKLGSKVDCWQAVYKLIHTTPINGPGQRSLKATYGFVGYTLHENLTPVKLSPERI